MSNSPKPLKTKTSDAQKDKKNKPEKLEKKKAPEETHEKKSDSKRKPEKVDKGDAPNAATAFVGCTLNVNNGKKHLKKYIKETLGLEYGTINAHYPYVAFVEFFILWLIRFSAKFNKKQPTKADLFEVTLENIKRGIRESKDLNDSILMSTERYDPAALDYTASLFDSRKNLEDFIAKKAFPSTSNFVVTNDALNFVCYLTLHEAARLTKTACEFSAFAKRNNVGIKNYISACNVHFSGEVKNLLHQRLSEIENLFARKKETEEDTEKKPDKKTDKKADTKTAKKPDKKKDQDAEEEEEDKEEESDKEEEEEDSD